MSNETIQTRIRRNPKFAELVGRRTKFAVVLSLIVLIPYYTFMMITAFNPQLLATKLSADGVMTIGWPVAAIMIVGFWLLTGLYVRRANSEFDELTAEVLEEAGK